MAEKAYQVTFGDEAADETFYGDVVELTIEENTATAGTIRLRLAATLQEDGTWSYLDDDRLSLFSKVSVKVGFTGGAGLAGALGGLTGAGGNDGLEPVFDGYLTAVNLRLGSQPGQTYLEAFGMDTAALMGLEEKIASWPNLSDGDIAEQILGGYDVSVEADPVQTVHQENDTTIMQRGTDLQFVRQLAQRNGFEFYFETSKESGEVTAFFRAPRLDGTPQPDLAIQFGADSNLTTFSASMRGQRPLNVQVAQTEVTSKSVNSAEVSDPALTKLGGNDLAALAGPLDQLVAPAGAQARLLLLGPPTSDATELHTLAQAVRDEAAWFITASGEINTDAYQAVLRPHRTVLVKGAGSQYSGAYYVTRVTHKLTSDGGYSQSFEARRNARDLTGSEKFGGAGLGLPVPGL
jgi:phage protein D